MLIVWILMKPVECWVKMTSKQANISVTSNWSGQTYILLLQKPAANKKAMSNWKRKWWNALKDLAFTFEQLTEDQSLNAVPCSYVTVCVEGWSKDVAAFVKYVFRDVGKKSQKSF